MSQTTLTVVTFHPGQVGVYIDGQLHKQGRVYMKRRILRSIMTSTRTINTTETMDVRPDRKRYTIPDTLNGVKEQYA